MRSNSAQVWSPENAGVKLPLLILSPCLGTLENATCGRNCYVTPVSSGVSKQREQHQKVATSALPSRGPTSGWNCYVTPPSSGVPKQGDNIKSGDLTPAFFGLHKWAGLLCHPYF